MTAALIAASSLGNVVERIGAYGGLVAIIGLGVLALLYFAQAREVKRLREWAGRAPERAAEIEQRVQTDAQKRVIAQPATPAAVAQYAVPPASLPSPTAGLTGEAAARATAAAIVAARATHPPTVGPPGQLARPAVPPAGTPGSPAPAPSPGGLGTPRAPAAPGSVPPAPAPAALQTPGLGSTAPSLPPKPAVPAPAPANPPAVAAMATKPPTATATAPPASGKPRVVAQPPAVANGNLGQETRESAAARPEPPPLPPPPVRPTSSATPPRDDDDGTPITRIIAIVGGALALVLVVGLIVVLMGGDDTEPTANKIADSPPPAQNENADDATPPSAPTPLNKGATTTKVLNGTVQAGLARNVANKLEKDGFKISEVGDNVDQTLTETAVYYSDGNRRGALAVAKIIGVSSSAVQPADRSIDVASSGARVVVTVGSDLIE